MNGTAQHRQQVLMWILQTQVTHGVVLDKRQKA